MVEARGIQHLLHVLSNLSTAEAQYAAAAILSEMACRQIGGADDLAAAQIVRSGGVSALVHALHGSSLSLQKHAAATLWALTQVDASAAEATAALANEEHAIEYLVGFLSPDTASETQGYAVAVLKVLAALPPGEGFKFIQDAFAASHAREAFEALVRQQDSDEEPGWQRSSSWLIDECTDVIRHLVMATDHELKDSNETRDQWRITDSQGSSHGQPDFKNSTVAAGGGGTVAAGGETAGASPSHMRQASPTHMRQASPSHTRQASPSHMRPQASPASIRPQASPASIRPP